MKKWTESERQLLRDNWNIPMREILKLLPDRNRKTIYWQLSELGYKRQTYKRFTPEEDKVIFENYKTLGNYAIGKIIKRTAKSIAKRMIVLGYKREPDDFKELAKSNKGCYQKGVSSERKLKDGLLQLIYDSKTERSFYNIKIEGKFIRYSRYLYENFYNEKLSSDDVVFHLDGDSMNLLKENLIKINRNDLLSKNNMADEAFVKRIFRIKNPEHIKFIIDSRPELIELKKNILKLNSKLNESKRKISETTGK
ncbi:hypothetical protein [Flavobacterium johnsoniae]|uniref:HNH endonuclease n=1 Tax=Flavobacterium johnsoniae TaxID=986 RepID=A0A1M5IJA2_FLAJO|nr:hypothetical protein [Flavobacterium johnsoniae]SHG28341.1 hypothetical protein SAMN05444388_102126 [Flavobacterium johnsoniae]